MSTDTVTIVPLTTVSYKGLSIILADYDDQRTETEGALSIDMSFTDEIAPNQSAFIFVEDVEVVLGEDTELTLSQSNIITVRIDSVSEVGEPLEVVISVTRSNPLVASPEVTRRSVFTMIAWLLMVVWLFSTLGSR